MKNIKKIIAILISISMCLSLSFCGGADESEYDDYPQAFEAGQEYEEDTDDYESEDEDTEEYEDDIDLKDDDQTVDSIYNGSGSVESFIGEPFYDGVIKNEEDALECLYATLDEFGGDRTTNLELYTIQETEDGITYYVFRQAAEDMLVYGASVKLCVNKEGKALGLVSTIVPGLNIDTEMEWRIDAKEAEEKVREECQLDRSDILSEYTKETILPIEDSTNFYYAWLVYSRNYDMDVHAAYLAHYVDEAGEYLYCTPVSSPEDISAENGGGAEFAFSDMSSETWKGSIKTGKGKTKSIEIPVMRDNESGKLILGDAKRKILCADYADFENNDTISPCYGSASGWDNLKLITYYNFIRIYDLYESTGWEGPDGIGTPTLILMDLVDENGEPVDNAFYTGRSHGFETFAADTSGLFGDEDLDIIGHEFTHCFTTTALTNNIYLNDYGAINEAMSDIMGNLSAMMLDEDNIPWLMGDTENGGKGIRNMADPNELAQPAFVWDKYYVPCVLEGDDNNDNGGVHTNSSLLNLISYRLDQAGMPVEEQFYYWMNVSFAMTPKTDYAQLSLIMPWIMDTFGYSEYKQALEDAIEETGIGGDRALPDTVPEGCGRICFTLDGRDPSKDADIVVNFVEDGSEDYCMTWPDDNTNTVAAHLSPGRYITVVEVINDEKEDPVMLAGGPSGWEVIEDTDDIFTGNDEICSDLKEGEIIELDGKGLMEAAGF